MEAVIVDMFDKCASAAVDLGFSDPALASAVLVGAENVDVVMGRLSGPFRKPVAVALEQIDLAAIEESIGDHLQPMFDHLWTAAGICTGSISFSGDGWAGYRGEGPYEL